MLATYHKKIARIVEENHLPSSVVESPAWTDFEEWLGLPHTTLYRVNQLINDVEEENLRKSQQAGNENSFPLFMIHFVARLFNLN